MIVALAGRRIDSDNAEEVRFPLARIEHVKRELKNFFVQQQVTLLVTSAACGADLLALQVANEMSLLCKIILPFPKEIFRKTSVDDCSGKWIGIFNQIIKYHKDQIKIMDYHQNDSRAYEKTNVNIIQEALSIKQSMKRDSRDDALAAVVIWDGKQKNESDVTFHFIEEVKERNIRLYEILTI